MHYTPSSSATEEHITKIFKILVREDANELGMVFADSTKNHPQEARVRGETQQFNSETEKLRFLAKAHQKGFRNFETTRGDIDIERMVLAELARRQKAEKKKTKA
ncbi:hypothetical protein IPN35_06025 [Candidatus Peregrinibacteria bacterium]|nr:MAG: hypothetical protein IPN35_06025 [Candidatus Peregrinibacteria bacterium]